MISLLGMADDLWDLDWMLKLAGQLLISVFVAWGGLQIIFASAWLVGDGVAEPVDGHHRVFDRRVHQCGQFRGWVGRSVVGHCGDRRHRIRHLFIHHRPQLASYASMATLIDIAMVGMCVGFLMHNWHPAKLFMGDSGSMLLGYLITCASIVMTGRLDPASIHASIYLPVFMPILLPILVLFLPILDMCLAIVRRLRKGQSPMHPDACTCIIACCASVIPCRGLC